MGSAVRTLRLGFIGGWGKGQSEMMHTGRVSTTISRWAGILLWSWILRVCNGWVQGGWFIEVQFRLSIFDSLMYRLYLYPTRSSIWFCRLISELLWVASHGCWSVIGWGSGWSLTWSQSLTISSCFNLWVEYYDVISCARRRSMVVARHCVIRWWCMRVSEYDALSCWVTLRLEFMIW